jgi:hypothetical protein
MGLLADHAPEGGKRGPKLVETGVTGHGVLKAEGKYRICPCSVPSQALGSCGAKLLNVRLSQGAIGAAIEGLSPDTLLHDLEFLPLGGREAPKKVP